MDLGMLIIWLIIGAVAGFLAAKVMRGHDFGLLWNIIYGVIGSYVGNFLFKFIFQRMLISANAGYQDWRWWVASILLAFGGACLVLWLVPRVKKFLNK